jgi:hypothetical protein
VAAGWAQIEAEIGSKWCSIGAFGMSLTTILAADAPRFQEQSRFSATRPNEPAWLTAN